MIDTEITVSQNVQIKSNELKLTSYEESNQNAIDEQKDAKDINLLQNEFKSGFRQRLFKQRST